MCGVMLDGWQGVSVSYWGQGCMAARLACIPSAIAPWVDVFGVGKGCKRSRSSWGAGRAFDRMQ